MTVKIHQNESAFKAFNKCTVESSKTKGGVTFSQHLYFHFYYDEEVNGKKKKKLKRSISPPFQTPEVLSTPGEQVA